MLLALTGHPPAQPANTALWLAHAIEHALLKHENPSGKNDVLLTAWGSQPKVILPGCHSTIL